MAGSHLRIYYGPEDQTSVSSVAECDRNDVTIPLRQILSTLADAVQSNRGWLQDFEDDEVTISTDLYEVILAYQHYRRPSA